MSLAQPGQAGQFTGPSSPDDIFCGRASPHQRQILNPTYGCVGRIMLAIGLFQTFYQLAVRDMHESAS